MIAACLPVGLKTILQDRKSTFLRRMRKHWLELIADHEMADCFRQTVATGGGTISDDALAEAVRGSGGHPYMLQLVGHRMWTLSQAVDNARVGKGLAGEYRARLLRTGFIQPAGRGHVELANAQVRSWMLNRARSAESDTPARPADLPPNAGPNRNPPA